jgi:ParB family chromosome partitioning protein
MDESKRVIELEVNQIQPNPLQPRGLIPSESLMELVNSIKEHGVLEPLVVAHTPAGYQIIAGERRWRAAKLAGFDHIPVIIKETSPKGMLEMALVENVQREDLNPLERAKAFLKLTEEFSLTNQEVAKRISKSTSYVSNTLNLLALPDALKDGLLSGLITEGHARALLAIRDHRLMIEVYKIVLKETASVRRAEDLARRYKAKAGLNFPSNENIEEIKYIISEDIDKMQEEINQALGERTEVKLIRTQRQTKLFIVLHGGVKDTEPLLQNIYKSLTKLKD